MSDVRPPVACLGCGCTLLIPRWLCDSCRDAGSREIECMIAAEAALTPAAKQEREQRIDARIAAAGGEVRCR